MKPTGAYEAARASALSGVPESTLYLWARQQLIEPSVSPERIKLWAWADLVAARAVYWLRHPAPDEGRQPTAMRVVHELLTYLRAESLTLGDALAERGIRLFADAAGQPHVEVGERLTEGRHRFMQGEYPPFVIELLAEFAGEAGAIGPDLRCPSKLVRIRPGILSGEPFVVDTRIETRVLATLRNRGFGEDEVLEWYPGLTREGLRDAVQLECRLSENIRRLAAA